MATTRVATLGADPFQSIEDSNRTGYERAVRLGMRHDAARLAAEHPEYLLYYRIVPPMDFRVAFSSKDGINAVLTRLGYDVSGIAEPERERKDESDIRPKLNW